MTTQKPDDGLDTILPDSDIEIRHETITVTEITFLQSLTLDPLIGPMIADMKTLFAEEADGETVSYQAMAAVFGKHADILLQMIAMTTGKPREWIESLSDADGQLLTMTFWTVNQGFFTRRLVIETMASSVQAEEHRQDGAMSLPH